MTFHSIHRVLTGAKILIGLALLPSFANAEIKEGQTVEPKSLQFQFRLKAQAGQYFGKDAVTSAFIQDRFTVHLQPTENMSETLNFFNMSDLHLSAPVVVNAPKIETTQCFGTGLIQHVQVQIISPTTILGIQDFRVYISDRNNPSEIETQLRAYRTQHIPTNDLNTDTPCNNEYRELTSGLEDGLINLQAQLKLTADAYTCSSSLKIITDGGNPFPHFNTVINASQGFFGRLVMPGVSPVLVGGKASPIPAPTSCPTPTSNDDESND